MSLDLEELEQLPFLGKISVMAALNPNMVNRYYDWDLSRQATRRLSKIKAKNSKAKHRKKFNR